MTLITNPWRFSSRTLNLAVWNKRAKTRVSACHIFDVCHVRECTYTPVTPFMKEIEGANKGHSGVPNKLLWLTTYPRCRLYNDRALRWNLQTFLGMYFSYRFQYRLILPNKRFKALGNNNIINNQSDYGIRRMPELRCQN